MDNFGENNSNTENTQPLQDNTSGSSASPEKTSEPNLFQNIPNEAASPEASSSQQNTEQPGFMQSGLGQPSFTQPSSEQSSFGQSGLGQTNLGQSGFGQSNLGQQSYAQPGYGQPAAPQPQYRPAPPQSNDAAQPYQNAAQNQQTPPPYQQGAYPPPNNGYQNGYYAPYGNRAMPQGQYAQPDQQPNGVQNVPPKKKRLSAVWMAIIIALIAAMFIAIVILSVVVAKRAAEFSETKSDSSFSSLETQTASEKSKDKDTKRVRITLPTSPRPVLEAKYYADEETGLLTTEGVAQRVLPSQVLIGVYSDTPYQMTSLGSGIIISTDGYILTNAHVVDEDAQFKAQLNDGRQFEAKLVGIDRKQDLAVVKIEADDLVSAEIGNSDEVILGEQVAVIGAGGSLENSITFGYVSALGREIETDYSSSGTLRCIQTDAALNPGNSGGALVNMYGQVIGISVGGLDHVVYDGIGFAIEINDAVPVAEALIENGYVPGRAKLGITFIAMDSATAEGLGVVEGICVMSVDPTCDIATKDLRPYDIITEIDGKPVKDLDSVMDVLDDKIAGEEITLTVYRKTVTEEVTTFEITAKLEQKID